MRRSARALLVCLAATASISTLFALDPNEVVFDVSGRALTVLDISTTPTPKLAGLKGHKDVLHWCELGDRFIVTHGKNPAWKLPAGANQAEDLTVKPELSEPLLAMRRGLHSPLKAFEKKIHILFREGTFTVFQAPAPVLKRIAALEGNHFKVVRFAQDLALRVKVSRILDRLNGKKKKRKVTGDGDFLPNESRMTADVETLQNFKTRYSFSEGYEKSAQWCLEKFRAIGLDAEFQKYDDYGRPQKNVVAQVGLATPPDGFYIVCAHLDSTSSNPKVSAPGADDNGSGCAGVIEIARLFATSEHASKLRFVLFAGEEVGMRGSAAYVKHLKATGELAKVKGVINYDMISFDAKPPLSCLFETKSFCEDFIAPFLTLAQQTPGFEPTVSYHPWGSDHMPFLREKKLCFLLIEDEFGSNPHYHKETDLLKHTNPALMTAIVKNVTVILQGLLQAE